MYVCVCPLLLRTAAAVCVQGALSGWVFSFLHETFNVQHECSASALNVWGSASQTFNSLFEDVDRYFGGKKSFFEFFPSEGCYEWCVRPPI